MEKNSRTEMLPGKRYFYRCCKARCSASHVNKEFWQQFQNYAPPSLRVIRIKICTYHNNTRKMVPITGRARSFLVVIFIHVNRKEEEEEGETEQQQFTNKRFEISKTK